MDHESICKRGYRTDQGNRQDDKVILGLSGGVDSSVVALLVHKAIGDNLTCIFVDNGLLRKDEAKKLKQVLKQHLKINIRFVNAGNLFLKDLEKVTDPEKNEKSSEKSLWMYSRLKPKRSRVLNSLPRERFIRM
jgi:GMP synthase PP-ATPase subunit